MCTSEKISPKQILGIIRNKKYWKFGICRRFCVSASKHGVVIPTMLPDIL